MNGTESKVPHNVYIMKVILPLMLNCEYMLFKLYAGTPLRLNPFLSHWVEVVQLYDGRIDNPLKASESEVSKEAYAGLRWMRVCGARLELVKRILLARGGEV